MTRMGVAVALAVGRVDSGRALSLAKIVYCHRIGYQPFQIPSARSSAIAAFVLAPICSLSI